MIRRSVLMAFAACAGAAGPAAGQQDAKKTDTQPALSGPRVAEGPAPSGIVARDFNGEVRRHETTPEEAAIGKLPLDEAVMVKARRVLDRRDAIIDRFVAENLDLLVKFGAAAGGGDKLDQAALGLEAFQKLAPLREGGSLWEQVKAALPEEPAKQFNAMMTEYWDAVVADGKRIKNEQGKERTRFEIVAAERLQILGKEIERSFYRQEKSGTILISYLSKDLVLTEYQKTRLRQMTLEFAGRTDMTPTEKQQQMLVVEMLSVLTEEQRTKVAKTLGL